MIACRHPVLALLALALWLSVSELPARGAEHDPVQAAAAYRKGAPPVEPASDTTILCEAEEFQVQAPGWAARPWGSNYYAATFANSFLSRKAYLGAPEQCERTTAVIEAKVPKAGRYLALVRYEAAYRFETRFQLTVEQNGKTKLDRPYGARDNLKIWAFRQGLQAEVAWDWGADENVVWEGHDAFVELEAGTARLTLTAGKQPGNAARRNVDLVLLTSDVEQIQKRLKTENYLPLDGLLTQAGDVYVKVHNHKDAGPLTLTIPPGTEHSPYWVHIREWKPKTITAKPGETTDWVEVGSLLDTLNDGQWTLGAKGQGAVRYDLEFGVRTAAGQVQTARKLDGFTGDAQLAYDADTRYSQRVRTTREVLEGLVAFLRQQPVPGSPPQWTLVYGYTFTRSPHDEKYNALIDEFVRLMGATALTTGPRDEVPAGGLVRGYIDVRGVPTNKLEEHCRKLQAEGKADRVAVVSLGDEIGLAAPPAQDQAGFRAWLQGRKVRPADLDPAWGDDWAKVTFDPTPAAAKGKPALYYYSKLYGYRYGINQLKERTDILNRFLPHAGVGANFSPHHGHFYLGDTHHWISLFREGGMTMPWGEDYIWQVPVGTQQMNFLMLDMFRAGIRGRAGAKLHFYVMPHTPGNTTRSWRRQFYGDLAHGATVLNLFEFRPVQAAYTENHCSMPEMYQEVRRSLHELGRFEDIVQDGRVRPGLAALWFSEAGDVWDDHHAPFDAAKRTLYVAARHQQLPLDVVVEGDDLKDYRVLYLTDPHVSRAASRVIADWVKAGGRLFATAGAGMFDELNRPNDVLRELLGVDQQDLEVSADVIRLEKQDLPFARPVAALPREGQGELPVFGARSKFTARGANVLRKFADGAPAVTERSHGSGRAVYCGFQPGLSYFKPALPLRPVDRGATDDTLAHFMPTDFDADAARLIGSVAADLERPVVCSQPLVETTVLEAKQGVVIPLVNWRAGPVKGLKVAVAIKVPTAKVSLASGKPVQHGREGGKDVFTFDLDEADALILR